MPVGINTQSIDIPTEPINHPADEVSNAASQLDAAFDHSVHYLVIAASGCRPDRLVKLGTDKEITWSEEIHNRLVVLAVKSLSSLIQTGVERHAGNLYREGVEEGTLLPNFVVNVVSPLNIGWELAVCDAVCRLKSEMEDQRILNLTGVVPFPDHDRHWPQWARQIVTAYTSVSSTASHQMLPIAIAHPTNAVVKTPQEAADANKATAIWTGRQLAEEARYGNSVAILSLNDGSYEPEKHLVGEMKRLGVKCTPQNLWRNWVKYSGFM